jgi:hypothetical protein
LRNTDRLAEHVTTPVSVHSLSVARRPKTPVALWNNHADALSTQLLLLLLRRARSPSPLLVSRRRALIRRTVDAEQDVIDDVDDDVEANEGGAGLNAEADRIVCRQDSRGDDGATCRPDT